jgi:xanthine dehydrogenase YagS FAD-binding subunit
MAVIRDVMPMFELLQPASVDDALAALDRHRDAWVLAGGLDTFDWLKDRIKRPSHVLDLGGVAELKGIRATDDGGLEIGAMTTLTDIVRHPLVRDRFGILAEAASVVASPQVRNQGTIGGNLSQDARCWYYRAGWPCYRAGGNICYADTPQSINREHAIFDADRCVAVNPSDTAPALIALDAQLVLRSARSERVIEAERYFVGPAIDITRMTARRPGELLTAIRIPSAWSGARFTFEKVRDRNVWDFALLSVSSAMVTSGGRIERVRLVANGVAATPTRLARVEAAIQGRPQNRETGELAGALAIEGAQPLAHNGYKIPMLRNLVRRAVSGEPALT